MKKNVFLAAIVVWVTFAFNPNSFAWGNKNATGQITSINYHNRFTPNVTVQGYAEPFNIGKNYE